MWRAALSAAVVMTVASAGFARGQEGASAPYAIAPGLFDPAQPDLGLRPAPGTETFAVFRPSDAGGRFNNGVVLTPFKGRLYAQWQSSARDEDAPDTWVAYSVSDDGQHWSAPGVLTPALEVVHPAT